MLTWRVPLKQAFPPPTTQENIRLTPTIRGTSELPPTTAFGLTFTSLMCGLGMAVKKILSLCTKGTPCPPCQRLDDTVTTPPKLPEHSWAWSETWRSCSSPTSSIHPLELVSSWSWREVCVFPGSSVCVLFLEYETFLRQTRQTNTRKEFILMSLWLA